MEQRNIQVCGGTKISNYKANVRSSDGKVLGVVSDRYKIVQNAEAFEFTDSLIGGEVHYETAGSLNGGKKIWLLAKLPDTEIAGDKTEPYLCFSNTHDGSGAIRVCMTPIRVVCNNTLNLALDNAKRSWSVRHTGDIRRKAHEARACLYLAHNYIQSLAERADRMANTTRDPGAAEQNSGRAFSCGREQQRAGEARRGEAENGIYDLLFCAGHFEVSGHRLGSCQRHERHDLPQRSPPEDRELPGKQLGQNHGRPHPAG